MAGNQKYLNTVTARIADSIINYARTHVREQFHASDLRRFVNTDVGCAPSSADRVLRNLRQMGVVDYTVVNRAQSLYKINAVAKLPQ